MCMFIDIFFLFNEQFEEFLSKIISKTLMQ